eukprot:5519584-Pyramimonas_sp.AAC.1
MFGCMHSVGDAWIHLPLRASILCYGGRERAPSWPGGDASCSFFCIVEEGGCARLCHPGPGSPDAAVSCATRRSAP